VLNTRIDDDAQNNAGIGRYRALFISDIHLGTKACRAEAFLDFLRDHHAPRIYLVGDIVDFWHIKRGVYWPQSHNDVLQKLLRKVRKGTDLVYIPGNHDEAMRDYCGLQFGGIAIERQAVHVAADGRRYLVMHGDEFDVVVRYARWLALLGDWSYTMALWLNTHLNVARRWFGMPYWSLSAHLKHKVKRAVNYIGEFEQALLQAARRQGAQAPRVCIALMCLALAVEPRLASVLEICVGLQRGDLTCTDLLSNTLLAAVTSEDHTALGSSMSLRGT